MKYLIFKDCYEEYDNIYISTEENAEKGDLVVYDGNESPGLAKVVNIMDELTAITSDRYFIEAIKVMDDNPAVWYDLQGRRLEGKPTRKGIYINNRKKVAL